MPGGLVNVQCLQLMGAAEVAEAVEDLVGSTFPFQKVNFST